MVSDGTVRGTFDLNADPALSKLRSLKSEGAATDAMMSQLGRTMDTIGGSTATGRLDDYRDHLRGVGSAADDTTAQVSAAWDVQRRSIDDSSTRIEARVDLLQDRVERYGRTRASATVELGGFDRVNAQLVELEERLDKLSRQRSSPTVSLGGGFVGNGGGLPGTSSSTSGGSGLGFGGKVALGLGSLLPAFQALPVSATALLGSAAGATLGAATAYGGAAATLGTGVGLTALVAKPAIKELQALQKEQTKYNEIVARYGEASKQAAVGREALNRAENKSPGADVAAKQLSLLGVDWRRATGPARQSVFSAIGNVAVAGRHAMPSFARSTNTAAAASGSAVSRFAGFLSEGQTTGAISALVSTFAHDLPTTEHTLENVTTTVEHLAVAARPFFTEANQWVESWTHGMSSNTSNEQRVQTTMRGLVDETKDWGRLAGATYNTLKDIFNMGRPSGDSMVVELTKTLDSWDSWIQRNPAKVSKFFKEAQTTTEGIGSALLGIAHTLSQLATQLTPLFNQGTGFISLASKTGLLSSPLGVGGTYALYRGLTGHGGGSSGGAPRAGAAGGLGGGGPWVLGRGSGMREGVSNVRTVSTVTRGADGTFIAGPMALGEEEASTAAGPFVGIASRSRWARLGASARTAASGLGERAGGLARGVAPFLALQDASTLASGSNPLHTRSAVGGVVSGVAQGALFGAALGTVGGPLDPLTVPAGAALGAVGGLVAGVASNAGGLHRDIFGPSASEHDSERLEGLNKEIKSLGGNLRALSPEQLKKINTTAKELAQQKPLNGVTSELVHLEKETGRAAQAMRGSTEHIGDSFSAMHMASKKSFREIEDVVDTTAEGIKQELGDKTLQAKDALSTNFADAAKAADLRMKETGEFTAKGMAFVTRELGEALNVFGIKVPKNASAAALRTALSAAQSGDSSVGFNKAGGAQDLTAAARAKQGRHARGGVIGGRGLLDTQSVAGGRAAAGEMWIANRHTLNDLTAATIEKYGMTAQQLITNETRTHSSPGYARGGAITLKAPPASGLGGAPGAIADGAGALYANALQVKVNRQLGSMMGGGSLAGLSGFHGGGGTSSSNEALGRRMMIAAGWPSSEWPYLKALWTQESGWNANAVNSSSGAYGIPQALGHGHPYALGDASAQIAWGLNYIRGRYGSPSGAEAHERSNNWYARGGRAPVWAGWHAGGGSYETRGPTVFGAGENGREKVTISPVHSNNTGSGGHTISIKIERVSLASGADVEAVAREVAGKILDELDAVGAGPSDRELIGR